MAADSASIKAAMQRLMAEDKPNSGTRPPNLRVTEDAHENCSTCIHWNGAGLCRAYQYKTQPNEVSDSWAPKPT